MSKPAKWSARMPETKRKFLVLVTMGLISSLIMLDSNIVAVALPSIARSLGAAFTEIEWVVSAYILTFAALLLAAGAYADRHGRKLAMLIGIAIFTVASGLCGMATSALMLNLARALQGIGAALLLTASLAVINHTFAGAERAKAYAFWGACLGIAITCGPIIGGVITALFGWRWAFLMNLPICTVLFIAACMVVEESSDHEAKRLDYAGIVTFSTGLFFLIWALIDGNNLGWLGKDILTRLLVSAVLLVSFYFIEARQLRPMVDFSLFRQPTFLGSAFAMLGYAGGAQVLIFFLPLLLQNAYGFAPATAGVAMLPFALPMFLTPRFGAGLGAHYSGRVLLTLGLAITTAGNLLMYAFSTAHAAYPIFAVGMLIAGIGAGLLNSETAKVMQGAVPAQRAGMASGISATTRFVGLLVGVAALGAVLSTGVTKRFVASESVKELAPDLVASAAKRVASGDLSGVIGMLGHSAQDAIHAAAAAAFAGGFGDTSLIAAIVAAITGLLAFVFVRAAETAPVKGGKAAEIAPAME
ncbi:MULTISPECIES: MFS transporter [unclassified Achromobacter]|uniref:MFS transporter n=1 Tax=unclassified Achromobacter TaxID=2626865 RepID=UPI000B51BC49|nr:MULTISPECIES: MFS transporter [unclassified Achromobacter]OWT80251.1 MFS transporter [Achromobacter sp. HZ34]OWT82134.1 MFS transporter [Achromobacter sp. HZ28]